MMGKPKRSMMACMRRIGSAKQLIFTMTGFTTEAMHNRPSSVFGSATDPPFA